MEKLDNPSQEDWFDFWTAELIEAGYILKVLDQNIKGWQMYDGETIEYEEAVTVYKGTDRERVKLVKKKYILHRPVKYTPDRVIFWTEKSKDIFFTDVNEIVNGDVRYFLGHKLPDGQYLSVLDVKSPFGGKNSSDVSFSIKKKWVWVKERIYVNQAVMYPIKPLKSVVKYLWPMTFTPNRFLYTDRLKPNKVNPLCLKKLPNKKGVPNWTPRTLKEFLAQAS